MESFSALIADWPGGTRAFAQAIGVAAGTARQMKARDSISTRYFASIVTSAAQLGIEGVSAEKLLELAARKHREAA